MRQYFGAPHLLLGLNDIYYKYQRCSAPENACYTIHIPNVKEQKELKLEIDRRLFLFTENVSKSN